MRYNMTFFANPGLMGSLYLNKNMNLCKDCKYWEKCLNENYEPFSYGAGYCGHQKLGPHVQDPFNDCLIVSDCLDEATMFTGPDFGCIHHEPKT